MKLNRSKFNLALARSCMDTQDLYEKGIYKGTLCRALSGKSIKPGTAGKIAKGLGVDVTEIIETN